MEEPDVEEAVQLLVQRAIIVQPITLEYVVSRDPGDDLVLATALAGEAPCLVTGDNDLLVLKRFKGIPIIRPQEFWEFEARQG